MKLYKIRKIYNYLLELLMFFVKVS